jgi:hypothetical protein
MINVNKVYKKVLSIINKEQRGFLTPDEFNKLASQVQLAMLDQSIFEYNRFLNMGTVNRINSGYANLPSKVKERIDQFYKSSSVGLVQGAGTLPTDIYKIIELTNSDRTLPFELVDKHELPYLLSSPLTKPSTDYPIYYKTTTSSGATSVQANPTSISSATLDYIKIPSTPRWGYIVNTTYGTNIYDSNPYVETGLILDSTLNYSTSIGVVTTQSAGAAANDYTGTPGTTAGWTTSGSGTGASITITVGSGGTITGVKFNTAGTGYVKDDTITIDATAIFGSTSAILTLRNEDIYKSTTKGSVDFELHPSEEVNLVNGMLAMTGIVIKSPDITQMASQIIQSNAAAKQQ